jgi:hypothetical protein
LLHVGGGVDGLGEEGRGGGGGEGKDDAEFHRASF